MTLSFTPQLRNMLATAAFIPLLFSANQVLADETVQATPQWKISWCEKLAQKDTRLARIIRHYLRCDSIVKTNTAPIAVASAPQVSSDSSYITLDGTSSSDPDGDTLSYQWTQLAGTDAIVVSSLTSATPTFYIPTGSAGDGLVFELVVSDGELSNSTEVVIDVPYCNDAEGEVFNECVDPDWAGISAWEMLNDGTYENYHYTSGHNNYQANWQVVDSGEAPYGNVIDVQYAEGHNAYSMVRIYTPYGAGSTVDMAAYRYGHIEFDLRVLDWGSQQPTGLEVIIECVYPCTSAAYPVDAGEIGEWRKITMPLEYFINTGLDIHNVEMGFQISPRWGAQAGVHFQVDNVRWVEGEAPPVDTSYFLFSFDEPESIDAWQAWFANNNGSAPNKSFDNGALAFSPTWVSENDYFNHVVDLGGAYDLSRARLSADVLLPEEYFPNFEVGLSLFLLDSNGIYASGNFYGPWDPAVPSQFFNAEFYNAEFGISSSEENFDITQVTHIGIGIYAISGLPSSSSTILFDNIELNLNHLGEPPVNVDLGNPPPEAVDNYELSYLIYTSGVAPDYDMVFDYEPTGNGFYIRPFWQQDEFAVGIMLNRPDTFNFTDGELTVDVFIPQQAVATDGAIELEMEDAYGNFAKVQLQSFSTLTNSGWLTLTLSPINNATIGAPAHFDVTKITSMRLLITRGSAAEGSFGEFIINNLHLAPGIDFTNGGNSGGDNGGTGGDGLTFLPFDEFGWVANNWSGDSPLDWYQNGNNISVQFSTIKADDRMALINYLPQTINLTNGAFVGEVYVPSELFNSLQYLEVFVFDEDYNYASINFADSYALVVDGETNLARFELNADTLLNYDIQLDRIHALGLHFYFVNDQTGITETIEFTNLGLRYDPSLPIGNGEPSVDFSEWGVGAYNGEPGASFYASGDTFYVTPRWNAEDDQLAIGPDFNAPIDVKYGQLSLEVFIPEAAANSPATMTFFAQDVHGNRASTHPMALNMYGGAFWHTIFIAPFNAEAFATADPAFDASQLASFDIVIAANGSPLGEAGEFAIRNLMYMAGDPPPGNENLIENMFVYSTQGAAQPSWYFVGESLAVMPSWQSAEDIITAQASLPTLANLLYGGASFDIFAPAEYSQSNLSARLVFFDINYQTATTQWVELNTQTGNWQTIAVENISNHSFADQSAGFDATLVTQVNIEFAANGSLPPQADIEIANGRLINN